MRWFSLYLLLFLEFVKCSMLFCNLHQTVIEMYSSKCLYYLYTVPYILLKAVHFLLFLELAFIWIHNNVV